MTDATPAPPETHDQIAQRLRDAVEMIDYECVCSEPEGGVRDELRADHERRFTAALDRLIAYERARAVYEIADEQCGGTGGSAHHTVLCKRTRAELDRLSQREDAQP